MAKGQQRSNKETRKPKERKGCGEGRRTFRIHDEKAEATTPKGKPKA